tara:strand:- start:213 stop:809 length:597 start_codon:yes stop_codon:yes gene_type:complete
MSSGKNRGSRVDIVSPEQAREERILMRKFSTAIKDRDRYKKERNSYKKERDGCRKDLDNFVRTSKHLRDHIKHAERNSVDAIPVQELLPLLAEPVEIGTIVEAEPEPEPQEQVQPEPKRKSDLLEQQVEQGRRGTGWEEPPPIGRNPTDFGGPKKKPKRKTKNNKSGCCGSRPGADMKKKKKQTKRRKKQTRRYKRIR